MIDPQLQPLPHEPYDTLPLKLTEGDQPVPTLDEAVPPSCSWRGGIYISLFVNNLPHDGRVYARFGLNVVKTVRVQCTASRVAHRSSSGSEEPACSGMQGSASNRAM